MSPGDSFVVSYAPAEADWGIEEFMPAHRVGSAAESDSCVLRLRPSAFRRDCDANPAPASGYGAPVIQPTRDNFRKYIAKYLVLRSFEHLTLDRIKYTLVVSNLLDERLVLSKNEQALASLQQLRSAEPDERGTRLARRHQDTVLCALVTLRLYRLVESQVLGRPSLLLLILSLIIFLLRQTVRRRLARASRVRIFRILLIAATQLIGYRRVWTTVQVGKTLRSVDEFAATNCRINKTLIAAVLTLKEYDAFAFLARPDQTTTPPAEYTKHLRAHLNGFLDALLVNACYSVRQLLPLCNGPLLEKYCAINNIALGAITDITPTADVPSLSNLTDKLARLNSVRRFLVCQLLTVHDAPARSLFVLQLADQFHVDLHTAPVFVDASLRLRMLCRVLHDHVAVVQQLACLHTRFKTLHSLAPAADPANEDVLSSMGAAPHSALAEVLFADAGVPLAQLIDKLHNLTTSLKYFAKYKRAVGGSDNLREHEHKMSVFDLLGEELAALVKLYEACQADLSHEDSTSFLDGSAPSSCSTSNRNSGNLEHFNPKSFHTRSVRRHASVLESPVELDPAAGADRRLKRLSTGLQLGLLTVLEEPAGTQAKTGSMRSPNDLPHPVQHNFNFKTFEALTQRPEQRNTSRYSMYSLGSNISGISDIIASTHITFGGESPDLEKPGDDAVMTHVQMREKLEESYSRVLSLDDAGAARAVALGMYAKDVHAQLKKERYSEKDYASEKDGYATVDKDFPSVEKDASFLNALEKTLVMKTPCRHETA